MTRIAPASRRRVRRISVTSAREAALLLGKFSAPLQLCALTRRTRRLDAEATAARVLDTRTDVGASSAVPWRVPRPHAAATTRRSPGGSGLQVWPGRASGRDGMATPLPAGVPRRPGFAAGAGVSCSRDRRHETRAPSLRKRATETVAPAAKAGAPHPSCKDPSWARAWRSVDGDRMPASGVCPCGPFSWPLPARSCSRDRRHATRALLL